MTKKFNWLSYWNLNEKYFLFEEEGFKENNANNDKQKKAVIRKYSDKKVNSWILMCSTDKKIEFTPSLLEENKFFTFTKLTIIFWKKLFNKILK